MSQTWFVKHGGKTVGPLTSTQLRELVGAAKIQPTTKVRLGKDGEWIHANKVKGLLKERIIPQRQTSDSVPQIGGSKASPSKQPQVAARRNGGTKAGTSNGNRWRVTPLSLGLVVVAMALLLILMFSVHLSRMQAESKALAGARWEKLEPVNKTTGSIEAAKWKIRLWGIRHQQRLPRELADAVEDNTDGWGNPMRIELEGTPVSGYKISSAGEDGVFASQDDIAIRFSLDHEPIERINTFGLEEMQAELSEMNAQLESASAMVGDEAPTGRFTYSNGVFQILLDRDFEYFQSRCDSDKELESLLETLGNHGDQLMDHYERVDPRAKKHVPGGVFTQEQWNEVQEISEGFSLIEMKPIYDSILKEAVGGSVPDEMVAGEAGLEQEDRERLDQILASVMRLAATYLRQGELEKAEGEYRDALRYDPDFGPARRGLGQVLNSEGMLDEALNQIRTAILLNPKDAIAHNQLAWALVTCPAEDRDREELNEAVESAKKACELHVDNSAYLNTLGVAHYRSGDWSGAIESLENSVELGAQLPHNWLFIAMAQWRLGNKEQSQTLYEKSIEWRMNNRTDEELDSFFQEAESLLKTGVDSPSEN